MSTKRRAAVVAFTLVLSACGPSPTPPPSPAASQAAVTAAPSSTLAPSPSALSVPSAAPALASGAVFALPYAAGTVVTPGSKGLHDDNFSYLDDRATASPVGTGYTLVGAGLPTASPPGVGDASLDLVVNKPGTPIIPLAVGTVLASSAYCQTVLVDHGGGTWVEYVHIVPAVAAGQPVTRATTLGTVALALGAGVTGPCGLQSDAPHVHFAFLTGSGTSGQYVSMAGRVLCGHAVTAAGGIEGLSTGPGNPFTLPTCPGDGTPVPPTTVLSGTWVAPKDGAKLTTSALTLSAKPTVTPTTLAVTKVAFSIKWGSTTKAACPSVTKAGPGGVWSCKVDLLKLGAPIGKLTVSFDVTDSAGDVAKAPAGARTVTLWSVPMAPRKVTADLPCAVSQSCQTSEVAHVSWTAAVGPVTGYRVYVEPGSLTSLCPPFKWVAKGPRRLVATVGASTLKWVGTLNGSDDPARYWVVAFNQAGSSNLSVSNLVTEALIMECNP